MNIGVGAPCHTDDRKFIQTFNQCLAGLKPEPDISYIHVNDGSEGLGAARTRVFDYLFDQGCDVVLNASIDHYLFPDILRHIRKDRITGFGYLACKPSTVISVVKRMFAPHAWTGVYAVPRKIWMGFKASDHAYKWDGEGDSIQWYTLENNLAIKRVKVPKYWLLRYSTRMKEHAVELGGRRAVSKLMDAWD